MTPQQAAEAKYPYNPENFLDKIQTNMQRDAYISGLTDQPQLSRSVLEEVRERCKQAAHKASFSAKWDAVNKAIDEVNLDDLLPVRDIDYKKLYENLLKLAEYSERDKPVGDGWIDVNVEKPNSQIWVRVLQKGKHHILPHWYDKESEKWYEYAAPGFTENITHWQHFKDLPPLPKAPNS